VPDPHRMRVLKYIPERLYGFCGDDVGNQVFFHLAVFRGGDPLPTHCPDCTVEGCAWASAPPPPVLGEEVDVEVDLSKQPEKGKAPRAVKVLRIEIPQPLAGNVETFDAQRGFGFVRGTDGVEYHLHNSEIIDRHLPMIGQTVRFFPGVRQGRPRACHIKVC